MPWISRLLRGDRVWVRLGADGEPVAGSDGRVDVLYKRGGKVYRAALRNLQADPEARTFSDEEIGDPGGAAASAANAPRAASNRVGRRRLPDSGAPAIDPFEAWVDGACSGNPGPCGIGLVLLDRGARRELSEYLGVGTNNVAELTAIIRALEEAPRDRTVIVHSDSSYALGLLGLGWKPKANQALVERMRDLAAGFSDLRLRKVEGHAGVVENERADRLARDAVSRKS